MKKSQAPGSHGELVSSLAVFALLSLAIACGGSSEGDARLRVQRPELRPGTRVDVPESRLLARWADFDQSENFVDWELSAARSEVIDFNQKRFLKVNRREGAVIGIPAPLTFAGAGEIEIELIAQSESYPLTVRLLDGEREVGSVEQRIRNYKAEQQVVFKFSSDLRSAWSIDRIELHLAVGTEATGISSIAVRDVPLGAYFPKGALDGLALIDQGGDARRARVLSSAFALEASFQVVDREQELRFCYALPLEERLAGQLLELYLTLQIHDGGREVYAFELDEDPDSPARWHRTSIELREWVGEGITASFELRNTTDSRPGMCALGQPEIVRRGGAAPTVLLITSDTHRADHVGFLSAVGELRTETIDRLASEGVAFTDAFASINNTTPSHVSLFTGLTPRDTGVVANARPLAGEAPTLAERFRHLGYATLASVSAAPVHHEFSGLGQGFDRYSSPGLRSARSSVETLRQLEEWLPDFDGLPLFVWLHLYDAHGPYQPPPEYERLYYSAEADPYDPAIPGADPSIAPYWDRAIADPAYTEALYKSEITFLDEQLGKLLGKERFQSGTIAFTADHGEDQRHGERPFDHRGLSLGTLAVPLILKSPQLPAGTRRTEPVRMIDVGRTLLNLAGHPEVEFPGRDISRPSAAATEPRFAIQANGTGASVQLERWMLLLHLRHSRLDAEPSEGGSRDRLHEVRLFDCRNDPDCSKDVSGEFPEPTARLRALLIHWLTEGEPRRWQDSAAAPGAAAARQLEELGYVSTEETSASDHWIDPACKCWWCRKFE